MIAGREKYAQNRGKIASLKVRRNLTGFNGINMKPFQKPDSVEEDQGEINRFDVL